MTGTLCQSVRRILVAGLALSAFLLGPPRHAWAQG